MPHQYVGLYTNTDRAAGCTTIPEECGEHVQKVILRCAVCRHRQDTVVDLKISDT